MSSQERVREGCLRQLAATVMQQQASWNERPLVGGGNEGLTEAAAAKHPILSIGQLADCQLRGVDIPSVTQRVKAEGSRRVL